MEEDPHSSAELCLPQIIGHERPEQLSVLISKTFEVLCHLQGTGLCSEDVPSCFSNFGGGMVVCVSVSVYAGVCQGWGELSRK